MRWNVLPKHLHTVGALLLICVARLKPPQWVRIHLICRLLSGVVLLLSCLGGCPPKWLQPAKCGALSRRLMCARWELCWERHPWSAECEEDFLGSTDLVFAVLCRRSSYSRHACHSCLYFCSCTPDRQGLYCSDVQYCVVTCLLIYYGDIPVLLCWTCATQQSCFVRKGWRTNAT